MTQQPSATSLTFNPVATKNTQILYKDLGLMDYQECWDYQQQLFDNVVSQKLTNRKLEPEEQIATHNYLLFCEHPHVYTLGKKGKQEHLLLNEQELDEHNARFYKINRGGDITYHGPGQLVGYPILDLDNFVTDLHIYVRSLEEAIILTLQEYGIESDRVEGLTGVWLDGKDPIKARKICAIGVRTSRWVTMHGFAFNVNNDLSYFNHIVPCGITDKAVTSLKQELGREVEMEEIKLKVKKHFARLFGAQMIDTANTQS